MSRRNKCDLNSLIFLDELYQETIIVSSLNSEHASFTQSNVDRLKKLWIEWKENFLSCRIEFRLTRLHKYCLTRQSFLNFRNEMHNCEFARMQNFWWWYMKIYSSKKISAVIIYWHQLNQIYQAWKNRRMNSKMMKNIKLICFRFIYSLIYYYWCNQFINRDFTHAHELDDVEKIKFTLNFQDFLKISSISLTERHEYVRVKAAACADDYSLINDDLHRLQTRSSACHRISRSKLVSIAKFRQWSAHHDFQSNFK